MWSASIHGVVAERNDGLERSDDIDASDLECNCESVSCCIRSVRDPPTESAK